MCISIWTPSHEHLTTTQFLVASPAFCRYSIYFFALRPTHPHHHHQHKYQRNKNKTLVAPPLVEPTIDRYDEYTNRNRPSGTPALHKNNKKSRTLTLDFNIDRKNIGRATRILPIFNLFFALCPTHSRHHHQNKYQHKKIKHWLHHHWSNQPYAMHLPPSAPKSCPPATDASPDNTDTSPPPHPFFDEYDKNIR